MTTFTPKQIAFAQKYLKARFELRSDRDDDLDEGLLTELSGRVRATIKTLPRAERVLSGLLGAAEKALRTGGAAEYRRQTDMLAERLENWEQLAELPDVKSVLEKGFLEKSQELTPEDVRAMQVA